MSLRSRARTLAKCEPATRVTAGILLLALAVTPVLVVIGAAVDVLRFGGVDFKALYLAGLGVRKGVGLYEVGFVDAVPRPRATRYLYPPVAVLPFVVLSILPPFTARVLYLLAQFATLYAGVLVLLRSYGYRLDVLERLAVAWLLAGVQPVVFVMRIGNVTGFVAGCLCLSAAVTIAPRGPDQPFLGGALATLASFPKPYVAPAGAHLLGDRSRLAGAAAAGLGLVVSGIVLFGPETTRAYLDVLRGGQAWGTTRTPPPLPRHFRPYARFLAARQILRGVILVVAALTALVAPEDAQQSVFALGCVAVPLVAPSADTLTLVVALPGFLVALLGEFRRGGHPAVVLGAALGVQTSVYAVRSVGEYGPEHLPTLPWDAIGRVIVLQPATVGLLLVFWLCTLRIWLRRRRVWTGFG